MKVIITGGAGFIGGHRNITKKLRKVVNFVYTEVQSRIRETVTRDVR